MLGQGGAGAVRKATWNYIPVAVKTLHVPDPTEFMNELNILAYVPTLLFKNSYILMHVVLFSSHSCPLLLAQATFS